MSLRPFSLALLALLQLKGVLAKADTWEFEYTIYRFGNAQVQFSGKLVVEESNSTLTSKVYGGDGSDVCTRSNRAAKIYGTHKGFLVIEMLSGFPGCSERVFIDQAGTNSLTQELQPSKGWVDTLDSASRNVKPTDLEKYAKLYERFNEAFTLEGTPPARLTSVNLGMSNSAGDKKLELAALREREKHLLAQLEVARLRAERNKNASHQDVARENSPELNQDPSRQNLIIGAPPGTSEGTQRTSSSDPTDASRPAPPSSGSPQVPYANPPSSAVTTAVVTAPVPFLPELQVTSSERRLALLVGNGSYRQSPLKNPRNDVRSMKAALVKAGFEVMAYEDLDFRGMRTAIRDFGDKLTRYDVGLFYYSGHGVQVEGNNYLVPVDSDIRRVDEITTSSLNANFILAKMESAQNKLNLVVLDACRDSPLGSMSRGLTRGLSSMDAAKGTMIAFSTAPGEVALDGEGDNSPYTKHLATAIQKRGLLLEQVFKEVRRNVVSETDGKQVPWENSSVMGDFFFVK